MPATAHVVCPHCDTVHRVRRQRLHEAPSVARATCRCSSNGWPDAIRFRKHANKSDLPLLVDFWAAWCGPCRAMAPIFEKAAAEFEPDVRFVKVDSDAVPELLRRFHDQNLPTIFARASRARDHAQIRALVSTCVAGVSFG